MKLKELLPYIDNVQLTIVKGNEKRYIEHFVGIEDYQESVIKVIRAGVYCLCIELEEEEWPH